MSRQLALAVLVVVAAGGVTAPVLAGAVPSGAGAAAGPPEGGRLAATADDAPFVSLQDQPAADATVTRIALDENGSARWTIQVRTRLSSGEEADEYRVFQDRFRSNRSRFVADFRQRMTGVVADANESLDRRMSASAFDASTRIEEAPQRWGVVAYSFRWDGFAARNGGRLIVGDVFGGNFFIEENSVLEIDLPAGHEVRTVTPTPDGRSNGTLEWEGPTTFASGTPRVVTTSGSGDDGVPVLGVVAVFGLVLLAGALVAAWRGGVLEDSTDRLADAPGSETGAGRSSDPAAEAGGADVHAADRGPVTDEDRIREVLTARGGRCKQSQIVEELDWSKSKTSRVLSRMAEDDRIEKLRIGRENVIELPEAE